MIAKGTYITKVYEKTFKLRKKKQYVMKNISESQYKIMHGI